MIYLEYEAYKERLISTQKLFNEVLAEAEELFSMTQAKSTKYGRDRVQTSCKRDIFDMYLCEKESKQIDERLREIKSLLEDRKYLLKEKEEELRQSKDVDDLVYYYKFVNGTNAEQIAAKLNYSVSQIYRILSKIRDAIKCELESDIIKA